MNRNELRRTTFRQIIRLGCSLTAVVLIAASFPTATASEQLFNCASSTLFSYEKGEQPSSTRYIFSYDEGKKELVKLQEGDRPIAIRVNYECREDAVQVYCERYSYGTYWTFQLTKADFSFLETIGEYAGQSIEAPISSRKGTCFKKPEAGGNDSAHSSAEEYREKYGHLWKELPGESDQSVREDGPKKLNAMTTDELHEKYGTDPNWREKHRATQETTRSASSDFWKSIIASQKACRKDNPTLVWQACWERALPEKCGGLVYQASSLTNESILRWYACAQSCIDAGIWDRNLGECVRDYTVD